ncbi:MAG: ABC transporter permease [Candidatus Omnitrophica bacterium]|nr:ABC transporter permease [Candidatus Omnitrophota bacterium]
MIAYILRRLLHMIPLLLGITVISFAVIHLAPGKPTTMTEAMNPKFSPEVRQKLERLYGLDKPLHIQYVDWFKRVAKLDFGRSFLDSRPVMDKIKERVGITLAINILAICLILAAALPIGISSAVRQNTLYDKFFTVFVFVGFAMPSFWLALALMDFFGVKMHWFPISGLKSLNFEYLSWPGKLIDMSSHLVLPVFVSAFGGLAGMSRYMRQNMIRELKMPYIYTARAKGLPEKVVIYKHAMKNALLPVVTILGLSVPGLLGGSVILESVFGIPGLGKLFFEAVMSRDYPLIMAELVITSILTLLGNMLADISYACVDPRIRYKKI